MFNFNGATYSADATSSITLPQSVIGGYAFKPNSRWTLVADYEWTQWNVFQSQNIAIQESAPNRLALLTGNGSNVSTTVRDWHNVSAVGAGTNFKLNNAWQFRGGYAYYERTTPTQTFVPDVPDSAVHLVTLGFSRSWERLVFDFAFNGFFYADRNVTNTVGNNVGASINGTYTNFTPAISMSLTYKFGNLDSPRIP